MRIKLLYIFFLVVSFAQFTLAQTNADSLTRELEALHQQSTITGLAVSIFNDQEVLYKNANGYADIKNKIPYSTSHIQNIGSVSKTYIAAALLKAVEDGNLTLDDPINNHLTFKVVNPNSSDIPITIRHLATHTSGIRDGRFYNNAYVLSEDISSWSKREKSIKKVFLSKMRRNRKMPLEAYLKSYLVKGGKYYSRSNFKKYKAGDQYLYSNVAAALLAQVIEGAVDEEFNAYSSRVVLKELKLVDSGWLHADVDMAEHAILYGPENKPLPKYELNTYPDGGMISNVDDLTTYMMAMMSGYNGKSEFLSTSSFKEMMTLQWSRPEFANTNTKDQFVGLLWDLNNRGDNIGHNGSDPGTFSFVRFNSELNLGFIILINCGIDEEESRPDSISKIARSMIKFGKKMNVNL